MFTLSYQVLTGAPLIFRQEPLQQWPALPTALHSAICPWSIQEQPWRPSALPYTQAAPQSHLWHNTHRTPCPQPFWHCEPAQCLAAPPALTCIALRNTKSRRVLLLGRRILCCLQKVLQPAAWWSAHQVTTRRGRMQTVKLNLATIMITSEHHSLHAHIMTSLMWWVVHGQGSHSCPLWHDVCYYGSLFQAALKGLDIQHAFTMAKGMVAHRCVPWTF